MKAKGKQMEGGGSVQRGWRTTKLVQPLNSNCELRPVNFDLSPRREAGDLEVEEKEERGAQSVGRAQAEMNRDWETKGDTKEGSERDGVSYSDHSAPWCPADSVC